MKKLLLVMAGLAISVSVIAQSWTYSVASGGRSNTDGFIGMEKDALGNVYISGDFEGTRNFGGTSITASGLSDMYLSKYNSSGAHQWTIQINGTGTNVMEAGGVTTDAAGNIYVTGMFSFNVFFGSGSVSFTNPGGNQDAFIAKYGPSGNFIWAKAFTGNGNERITAIEALNTTIYMVGSYSQAMTYGVINLTAPAAGLDDAFLVKMDSSGTGIWGLKGGGSGEDRALALSVNSNSIYWAGYFYGNATFGGVGITAINNSPDMFIVKVNDTGNQQWLKDYGGNWGEQINGISQDPWGNLFCTGNFYGTVVFGTGMIITEAYGMQPAGNGDAFVIKLNSSDGTCQWVRQIKCINGDNNEVSYGISTDPGGSAFVTGAFNGNTVFSTNTSQTGTSLTATNGKDAFVAKYGQTGTLLWVQKIGGSNVDVGKAIVWDANGFCIVGGNFGGSLTIGSLPPINASASGISSQFIARYDGLSSGIEEFNTGISFEAFPNPANNFITVTTNRDYPIDKYEIYTVNGALLLSDEVPGHRMEISINIDALETGVYFLHISSGKNKGIKKIQVN